MDLTLNIVKSSFIKGSILLCYTRPQFKKTETYAEIIVLLIHNLDENSEKFVYFFKKKPIRLVKCCKINFVYEVILKFKNVFHEKSRKYH